MQQKEDNIGEEFLILPIIVLRTEKSLTKSSLVVKLMNLNFAMKILFEEIIMASRTAITENRRKAKHKAMGAKRKAANRNKGTTPKFAVHEGEIKSK